MKRRKLGNDILGMLAGNVTATVANLLTIIVLSRYLGPGQYGLLTSILVIPMVILAFTQMGIRRSSVVMIGKKDVEENQVIGTIVILFFFTSLAGMLITLVSFLTLRIPDYSPLYILLVLVAIPLKICLLYAGGIFLGKEQIPQFRLLTWLPGVLTLVLTFLLVGIFQISITGALLAILCSDLLVSGYAISVLHKNQLLHFTFNSSILRRLVGMGMLFALSFFVMQLNYRIDVLMLKKLAGNETTGFYVLASQVAEQLWQIPFAVEIIVLSRVANAREEGKITETVLTLARLGWLSGLVGAALVYFLAPWLVPLIFGSAYAESISLIRILLPGMIFIIIFRILNSHLAGKGKPVYALYAFIPALVLNIILNYLWIPGYGATGAAWATNISYATGTVIFLLFYARIIRISLAELIHFRLLDFTFIRHPKNLIKWNQ